MPWSRDQMAARAAQEIKPGDYVNLGIGIPTLAANHINDPANVVLHSENGMLGVGPFPAPGQADPDLINAGKQTVSQLPTSSYFGSDQSFAMIRGGHIDLAILGAMEVAQNGDLANWSVPGKMMRGVGGAMDLVAGAKRVVAVMSHTNKNADAKIVPRCTLPITGKRVVNMIITQLCVFECSQQDNAPLKLVELAPGADLAIIEKQTTAAFEVELR